MERIRTAEEEVKILAFVRKQMVPVYGREFTRGGHDITHIERGEATANLILDPPDPKYPVSSLLVKVTGWCHDLHRTAYFDQFNFKEEEKTGWLVDMLKKGGLNQDEILTVVDAVAKHSRLNSPDDSPVLVYLKDVDHLDMGAIGILRIAAHRWNIPPYHSIDFEGKPASTAEKDLQSMVHDLYRCLEWEGFLRTSGAKALGKQRFAFMRTFLKELERELRELRVIP